MNHASPAPHPSTHYDSRVTKDPVRKQGEAAKSKGEARAHAAIKSKTVHTKKVPTIPTQIHTTH
jgi:hypothetical protein